MKLIKDNFEEYNLTFNNQKIEQTEKFLVMAFFFKGIDDLIIQKLSIKKILRLTCKRS